MHTSNHNQMNLDGIPQAQYPIRVYCGHCSHMAELLVVIEVLNSLYRLRCSQCGSGIKDLKVQQLPGVDFGG